jgi:cytosine/adenosine deaminase-related metal-dependent hydrolase
VQVFAARFVLPVSRPPVHDGAVAVDDGRIVACGPRDEVLAAAGRDAPVRELGAAAVLPGLVNAHCHVELSWMGRDRPPGDDYVGWLRGVLERRAAARPTETRRAAQRAIADVVDRGTVAIGDVANETWVVPLLARSELMGIAFHEVYAPRAADAEATLRLATANLEALSRDGDVRRAADRWRVALTPHAPHTTSEPLLRALAGRAETADHPLSIHVAESAAEVSLLEDGSGPLPELFRERGVWDEGWKPPRRTPVGQLDRLGVLTPGTLAVHCVQLARADRSRLQARAVHVVTCPRSNAYLGVGTAPVPELLAAGIPVALGTDSLASAPDLDPFAEMAALCRTHPRLSRAAVLRMATLNGATALGLADRLGSIAPGKLARLIVVALHAGDDDPLERICSVPEQVWPLGRAPLAGAPE